MDTLKVMDRDFSLKAKQLRRDGFIPGVILGGAEKASLSIQIKEADAKKLLATERVGSRIYLSLNEKLIPVQIKDKSLNPLKGEILNIDFQALQAGHKVNSVVHVVLENTDKITDILECMNMDIPYTALPKDMIDTVTIDVDGMGVGTTVMIKDVKELTNPALEITEDPETIIFRIEAKKQVEEEEEEKPAE